MILKVFSVYDAKACFFSNPVFDQKEASVIRGFCDEVLREDKHNQWNKHPEDFSLFLLGEFDNETGAIKTHPPVNLITASAAVASASETKVLN